MEEVFDAFDTLPFAKIKAELDNIRFRASKVYGLELKEASRVTKACEEITKVPDTKDGVHRLRGYLQAIKEDLEPFYNAVAKEFLLEHSLLPLPAWALP